MEEDKNTRKNKIKGVMLGFTVFATAVTAVVGLGEVFSKSEQPTNTSSIERILGFSRSIRIWAVAL